MTLKSIAVGVLFLASTTAGAATVEHSFFGTQPNPTPSSCKGKSEQGPCKSGKGNKLKIFEALKGSNETTKLPDTARYDARGGVFI
jgi:hypothetical protein